MNEFEKVFWEDALVRNFFLQQHSLKLKEFLNNSKVNSRFLKALRKEIETKNFGFLDQLDKVIQ